MMTTHVLGMAKSSVNLKGNKSRSLKLDLLQLAEAIAKLRSEGKSAKGFVLVLADEVKSTVDLWRVKHESTTDIEVICASLSTIERDRLQKEKTDNIEGNKKSKNEGGDPRLARATVGKELGERKLREELNRRFPGIQETNIKHSTISHIKWDFYGLHDTNEGFGK